MFGRNLKKVFLSKSYFSNISFIFRCENQKKESHLLHLNVLRTDQSSLHHKTLHVKNQDANDDAVFLKITILQMILIEHKKER